MSVVGVATVFVALALIVAAVTVMRALLDRKPAKTTGGTAPAATVERSGPGAASKIADGELRAVAIAAYAVHCSRSIHVPSPASPSQWSRGGRAAQIAKRLPRG